MRAAVYDEYGSDFNRIAVRSMPTPKVFPGSVLIHVRAASVNPVDWKLSTGALDGVIDAVFPVIPGWDVSGVVVATGPDTPEWTIGDEVLANARKDTLQAGTFAELVAVPAWLLARKPAQLPWDQAGGLPLAGGTALRTLDAIGVSAQSTVVIYGAGGAVGSLGVQIARARGARVIGTASPRNHGYLQELGAEAVAYGDGLADRILQLAPTGVDAVADFVGGQYGTTKLILKAVGQHASVVDSTVLKHGGQHIWVRPDATELRRLTDLVNQGKLTIRVGATYDLSGVPRAFSASQERRVQGKIVIVP